MSPLSEEKIEQIANEVGAPTSRYFPYWRTTVDLCRAIEAAVLEAQGEQEPVAWCVAYDDPRMGRIHSNPSMWELEIDAHVSRCDGRIVKAPLFAAPVVQPDMVRLYDDITEVVAKQLHYFDNVEKINGATTAKEVFDVLEGGIDRYRNDTVFHAKVCSLVAHLKQVIAATEKEN